MNHRDRYTEHRPLRSCLTPHVGRSPADAEVIERLQANAYHQGRGVYFTEEQLAAMPWQSRELIESEARRLFGPRRRD